jgi:Glyoxalase-like domain
VLSGIVIDALEVARMEDFWLEATRGRTRGLYLRFEPTTEPKVGKNRLHPDLAGGKDWPAEVERRLRLGATRIDIGQGEVKWDVLADPEGNEFCVVRSDHPGGWCQCGLATICLDVSVEHQFSQSAFWQAESGWKYTEYGNRYGEAWTRLRQTPGSRISLLMGPPVVPKLGRNRVRLEVTSEDWESGEFRDPGSNEFHVTRLAPTGTWLARSGGCERAR